MTRPESLLFCLLIKGKSSQSHYILWQRLFKIARGCYPGHPDTTLNFVQCGSEKKKKSGEKNHFCIGGDFFFRLQCLMLPSPLKNMIYFFRAFHQRRPQEEQNFSRFIAWLADLLRFLVSWSLAFLSPSLPVFMPRKLILKANFWPIKNRKRLCRGGKFAEVIFRWLGMWFWFCLTGQPW